MDINHFENSVLVIDDETFVLETTAIILERMGFKHVLTAESVEQALHMLANSQPVIKLVLTDLNMPGADGLELLRRFDDHGYQGDILLFSGEDSQTLRMAENLARARNLSVIGAIAKPLKLAALSVILSAHLPQTSTLEKQSDTPWITPEMLKSAIDAKELETWFQPKIDIASREPVGMEALARWPNSALGPISPDVFIPVAEETGLIHSLTYQLIEKAIKFDKQWRDQGLDLKMAINISMDSLHDTSFPDKLDKLVTDTGGKLSNLQLEVTESRLMEDLVRPLEVLLRLRMKKISLSIDDFGTGHSNLTQLRDLPFNELKLDRSYVHEAGNSTRSAMILESSVDLAKKLEMTIVAEGVDSLEAWQRVEQLKCDQVQGYYTAKPMPGGEVPAWLASWPELRRKLFS